jgi:FAD/FMN-containing dehydrogenase
MISTDFAVAASDLRATVQGQIVVRGEEPYARTRNIWNGAVDNQPALFALCKTAEDIQAAIHIARKYRIPISVRGAGHDWAGRSLRHEGLVLDLSYMRNVEVNPQTLTATVAGGATADDVIAAADAHGLAAVTGSIAAVGMAGLTLGGGYGPLNSRFGLALDNLLSVEVIRADGQRVTADASKNRDLFWAVRGGGGNFGVATSMCIQLHPMNQVLSGMIMFPWSEAEAVLRGFADIMSLASDEVSADAAILSAEDGDPVLVLLPCITGDAMQSEQAIVALKNLGTPLMSHIGPTTYGEMIFSLDRHVVNGQHNALQTRWLPDLTPEILSEIMAAVSRRTSPFSKIIFHDFHGAATRVASDATPFGLRQRHFLVEIVATWQGDDKDDGTSHREWAKNFSGALAPYSLAGGYANLLGSDAQDQIARAYGDNSDRLLRLKRQIDPDGIFTSAIPLPM